MDPSQGVVHDACGPLLVVPRSEPTVLQRAGLERGIAAWNDLGFTRLSLEGEGEPIAVGFEKGTFDGFYDPDTGEVLINAAVTDSRELEVIVAHELGHAMGLAHVPAAQQASVMNPGNLRLAPTADDSARLQALCP